MGIWSVRRARVALAGAVLAGGVGINNGIAGAQPQSKSSTPPQALVLTSGDVSSVLGSPLRGVSGPVTNDQVSVAEGVPTATMRRYRIDGYQSSFRLPVRRGVVTVADSVGRYRSVAAARWQYRIFRRIVAPPRGSKSVHLKGIGDRSRGYSAESAVLGTVAIVMRRGHYTARLTLYSVGAAPVSAAVRLARILDSHLRHAH